jgi:pimeloyl-ACP methyl ester carboxylesterase
MRTKGHTRLVSPTLPFLTAALALAACGFPGPAANPETAALLHRAVVNEPSRGYSISYLKEGDAEGQRVLFVHGTPGDAAGWTDYLMDVPEGFEYVAADRPGFGESGPDDAVPSIEEQAAALVPLLEARKAGRTILVGHSLGGPIVARLAADHPEKIAGLVILAGSLDPSLEEIHWVQYVGDMPPVSWLLPRMLRNANRELIPLQDSLLALQKVLPDVTAPVVIVHSRDDELVPFANVDYMERSFTRAAFVDVVALDGRNHFLPWNSKETVDAAILRVQELSADPP